MVKQGMRYMALCSDYDGTLATQGAVAEETLAAIRRLIASGRKLVLVTGRRVDDLLTVFPDARLCSGIVAENGAVLYWPETGVEEALVPPPPESFVQALRKRGVKVLAVGKVVIATEVPHDAEVAAVIAEMGLGCYCAFNKGSVMVLPTGVDKASGLKVLLPRIGLSLDQVVGVGDGENDEVLLACCRLGVAVANALPGLLQQADWVPSAPNGAGISELIDRLVDDDLAGVQRRPRAGGA